MKIAVYTISKNEEQFVERWHDSAKDADHVVLVDTGSTDSTVEVAQRLGVLTHEIRIHPWRFDDARNAAIALLPPEVDVCVSVDVDEVLSAGWREALEAQWGSANHGRYMYHWSPDLSFWYEKIHARYGFRWKHPVHEVLQPDRINEVWVNVEGMQVHHLPDPTKSRGQYLELLSLSVKEDPHNDRNAYYYARELRFYGLNEQAAAEYKRHLALPSARWAPERAASMRGLAVVEPEYAEEWLGKAIAECPGDREPRLELARIYYHAQRWQDCFETVEGALAITDRRYEYLSEAEAWGSEPYDLAAISCYHLGRHLEAEKYGGCALALDSTNERLAENLAWYRGER